MKYITKKYDLVVTPEDFSKIPLEDLQKLKDKLYDNPQLIDEYAQKNPNGLSRDELDIIMSWHDFVRGDFVVIKYLKKYAVFLEV